MDGFDKVCFPLFSFLFLFLGGKRNTKTYPTFSPSSNRKIVQKDYRRKVEKFTFTKGYFCDIAAKSVDHVSRKMRYFLATGNVVSNTGLDLMQVSGFVVFSFSLPFSFFPLLPPPQILSSRRQIELPSLFISFFLYSSWFFLCYYENYRCS